MLGDSYWAKVNKEGPNGCWLWTAAIGTSGHGAFNGLPHLGPGAHRLSWIASYGPIPARHTVKQVCGDKLCVNPEHLYLADRSSKFRWSNKPACKTHRDVFGLNRAAFDATRRCTDPRSNCWKWYGARGIRVCSEWLEDPQAFVSYIAALPGASDLSLSLDRIDNEGHYEPGNLRWATQIEQNRNQRRSKLLS